jgi:hypothetical protein
MLDRPLAHIVPQVGDSGLPSRWVSLPFSTLAITPQPPWQLLHVLFIFLLSTLTLYILRSIFPCNAPAVQCKAHCVARQNKDIGVTVY